MTFVCVGCRAPLFAATSEIASEKNDEVANESDETFEKVLNFSSARAASTHSQPDHSFGLPRTKLSCAKCDAHLGHVFHAPNQLPDRVRFCVSASACELQTSPLSPSQLAPPPAAPAAAAGANSNAASSSSSSLPSSDGASAASVSSAAASAAHRVAGMTQQAVAAKARRDEQNSASTFMVGAAALALVGVAVIYLFRKSK